MLPESSSSNEIWDSECQLGLYDEVLCPVNVVYADNGLGIVVDRESELFAAEH